MADAQTEPDEPKELDELTPFQRFEKFARKIIAVPKKEIDDQEKASSKS